MIVTPKQRFFVTGDLLYPAVLGAGIAWWVEALVRWKAQGNPPATVGWSLWFGAFFIAYHSRSFVILREEESSRDTRRKEVLAPGATRPTPHYSAREFVKDLIDCAALVLAFISLRLSDSKLDLGDTRREQVRAKKEAGSAREYSPREFVKDLIDCAALVLAFISLRLPDGKPDLADPVGAFVVAALIPLGALISQATARPILNLSWPLRSASLGVALYGAWNHCALARDSVVPSDVDRWVLGILIALLVAYLVCPHIFGVRTSEQRSQGDSPGFGSIEEKVRTTVAVLALLGVLTFVWTRIRAEPAETCALGEELAPRVSCTTSVPTTPAARHRPSKIKYWRSSLVLGAMRPTCVPIRATAICRLRQESQSQQTPILSVFAYFMNPFARSVFGEVL